MNKTLLRYVRARVMLALLHKRRASFDKSVLTPRNEYSIDSLSARGTGLLPFLDTTNLLKPTQTLPTNPTGTTSLVGVMAGLAVAYTPVKTGRLRVRIEATLANNTAGDGVGFQASHGIGTAPVNGAAVTGTQDGNVGQSISPAANNAYTITVIAELTGLALNVALWLDVVQKAITAGTATLTAMTVDITEF